MAKRVIMDEEELQDILNNLPNKINKNNYTKYGIHLGQFKGKNVFYCIYKIKEKYCEFLIRGIDSIKVIKTNITDIDRDILYENINGCR